MPAAHRSSPGCRRWHGGSLQNSGDREPEGGDGGIEVPPLRIHHLVAALHGADGSLQDCAARVTKALSRLQVRLLADDALAAHFLHPAVRVRDDPMTRQELGRALALVADGDRVREDISLLAGARLLVEVARADLDTDLVLLLAHAADFNRPRLCPPALRARRRARHAGRCPR